MYVSGNGKGLLVTCDEAGGWGGRNAAPLTTNLSARGWRVVKTKPQQLYKRYNQYSETNVMHLSFNLLRIKGLYMFRALLAHPQEALHKRHLVYCVRVMSVG
jgi:hypothetical protein